jgi:hypothetical protein
MLPRRSAHTGGAPTRKWVGLAIAAAMVGIAAACGDESPQPAANASTWICITFTTTDLQKLADVEGEFIDPDGLVAGLRGYHSNSNPPVLSLRLAPNVVPEEFLSSVAVRLERHPIIDAIEIVGDDCA